MKVYIAHSIDILEIFKQTYQSKDRRIKTKLDENAVMELLLLVTSDSYHVIQRSGIGLYEITLNVVPKKLHPRFNRLRLTPVNLNVTKEIIEKHSCECTNELLLNILSKVKASLDDDSEDSMRPTYDTIADFINLKSN